MKKILKFVDVVICALALGMFLFGLFTFTQINANMDRAFLIDIIGLWALSVGYLTWSLNYEK